MYIYILNKCVYILYIYICLLICFSISLYTYVFDNTFACPSQLSLPKVNAKTARKWYMKSHLIAETRGGFDACARRGGVQVAGEYYIGKVGDAHIYIYTYDSLEHCSCDLGSHIYIIYYQQILHTGHP